MILTLVQMAFTVIDRIFVVNQETKRRWKRNIIASTKKWTRERHDPSKVTQMFDELDRLIEEAENVSSSG